MARGRAHYDKPDARIRGGEASANRRTEPFDMADAVERWKKIAAEIYGEDD